MNLIKLVLLLLLPLAGFSQIQGEGEIYLVGDRIEAKFNGGGMDKFSEFINKNFDYSKVTKAGKLEGAFIIDKEGNVTKIRITQVLDVESATEFIRVLKMCPKWEPAKVGGKPTSVEIKYPMVFKQGQTNNKEESISKQNLEDANNIKGKTGVDPKQSKSRGIQKFYDYIKENYRNPDVPGLKGEVIVSFVINEDGSTGAFKIIKDLGYGTADELIRILKKSPKWSPAMKDGKPVKALMTLPVKIDIPQE